ncbi:MAG: metal-dependent hydrolase [Pyrinomonadaceae bacterium]
MATIISHSIAALALGRVFAPDKMPLRFWFLSCFCAICPDFDVIAFAFDVSYGDMLGHRGITHSLLFAFGLGVLIVLLWFRETQLFTGKWWLLVSYFFVVTASHSVLDAITNGGLGVAFFAPFYNERFFFPWRPVEVSPIGIEPFLSEWGLAVMVSEIKWIWIPSGLLVIMATFVRRLRSK